MGPFRAGGRGAGHCGMYSLGCGAFSGRDVWGCTGLRRAMEPRRVQRLCTRRAVGAPQAGMGGDVLGFSPNGGGPGAGAQRLEAGALVTARCSPPAPPPPPLPRPPPGRRLPAKESCRGAHAPLDAAEPPRQPQAHGRACATAKRVGAARAGGRAGGRERRERAAPGGGTALRGHTQHARLALKRTVGIQDNRRRDNTFVCEACNHDLGL